jgi:hypothetical protein
MSQPPCLDVPENRGAVYNNPAVNGALMSEIARALRADGVPSPRDPEQRRRLALSILVDAADRCLQQVPPLADPKGFPLKPPAKIPVSQFKMQFPLAAATRGEGPVQAEFTVQEDGAVSVHLLGAYPGYQFEVAAMGPLSLLLYSPAKVNGCPVPTIADSDGRAGLLAKWGESPPGLENLSPRLRAAIRI